MRNAGMLTTTRVCFGTALGPFNISRLSDEPSAVSPLDQYSFASAARSRAFCSPSVVRNCSAARAGASVPSESTSSALFSRSRVTASLETRLRSSICWSESLRFCFTRATNLLSVSSASSNGSVTSLAAVSAIAGDGDAVALGDGLGWVDTVVFVLPGGTGAQPVVNMITNQARMKTRRIMVMLVILHRAFQQRTTDYTGFMNDLRTINRLWRPVV